MTPAPDDRDLSPGARFANAAGAALMAAIGLLGTAFCGFLIWFWTDWLRNDRDLPPVDHWAFWMILTVSAAGFALPPIAFWRVYRRLARPPARPRR